MAYSNEMMIEDKVIAIIRKAIANPANADWKDNPWEGVNWNFVDADVHIAVKEADLGELHFDLNDFTAGCYQEFIEFGEIDDNMADQAA
jgi:hypothetical protein